MRMCFCSSASFIAGGVLTVIGVATIKKVENPSQIIFASIPLLFAVQQFSEGFLWLALTNSGYEYLEHFTTYMFLLFAEVLWPLCFPIAILLIEKNERRKKILKIFAVIGIMVAIYLAYTLLRFEAVATIIGNHIKYKQNYPDYLRIFGGVLYLLATIAPTFFSSIKHMKILGISILLSYIITKIFYIGFILSVWCFFSAILSIIVFIIMIGITKSNEKKYYVQHPYKTGLTN